MSKRALFEGVINAVAHRDYFLDGTQIQVDMFKDRLEISSPGSFYRGEKLGKTYDLSGIISKRRNELITAVLVSCNVMEAADGTDYDDKVLSFCYYQAHKVSEIAEYLGISDSTYLRKQVLGNLEKQGYLETGRISRATYFKTNPDMVMVE